MITREKKSAGPTSLAASIMISLCSFGGASPFWTRSRCLCAFSTITTEASTITPMAMAIPPRLMMFALMPSLYMAVKLIKIPTGSVKIETKALRKWRRKTMHTRATTIISSVSFRFRVSIAFVISVERS